MRKLTPAMEDELLAKRALRRQLSLKCLARDYDIAPNTIRKAIARAQRRKHALRSPA